MTATSGPGSKGRALVPGSARGPALVLSEPLSFWGGVDPADGRIVDRHHPQVGQSVHGMVLVMPSGRGSSSSSSVVAETIRAGTGPVAVILAEPDHIVALGAVVAAELYGRSIPVVVLERSAYETISSGQLLTIETEDGNTSVSP